MRSSVLSLLYGGAVFASLASLASVAGCGEDPAPVDPVPTAAEVRSYWGLNPGSCYRYRYTPAGAQIPAHGTMTILGPNTQRIAGKTVYIQSFQLDVGGEPGEFLLDADTTPGELRLLQFGEGSGPMRVTQTYDESPPLWTKLEYAADGSVDFADDVFTTQSTPRGGSGAVEHKWIVLNKADMAATPDGVKPAVKLSYSRSGIGTSFYYLVPGFGIANFTDSNNTTYQVCAARVCDASNNCTGAPSCAELMCTP